MRRIFGKNGPLIADKNLGKNYVPKPSRRRREPATAADKVALGAAEAKRRRKAERNLRNTGGAA